MTDQLRPWQPLPAVHCCACTAQAVRRASAVDGEAELVVTDGQVRWEIDPRAVPIERLACEEHAVQVADELCDRYSGASSMPLRMTWRYWLETRLYAAWKRVRR